MTGKATFEVRYADDTLAEQTIEYAGRYGTFVLVSALTRAQDAGAVTAITLKQTVAHARA